MPLDDVMSRPSRQVFEAGPGRKLAFSFLFLLISPFFVSLFPMLFWRMSQGQWGDLIGLAVLAVGLALLMVLIVIELMISLRARVAFGKDAVRIRLPRGRGIFPSLVFNDQTIRYEEIEAIEVRREVYGGQVAPVLLKGARIVLKDQTFVPLGYVNDANVDPALPFDEIAEKIAARASVEIRDVGHVHRSAQRKFLGLHASQEQLQPLEAAEIEQLNARHGRLIVGLVGLLIVLVGFGILSDRDRRYPWTNLTVEQAASETPAQ